MCPSFPFGYSLHLLPQIVRDDVLEPGHLCVARLAIEAKSPPSAA